MGAYNTLISDIDDWVRPPAAQWGSLVFSLMHFREAQPAYVRVNEILSRAPSGVGGVIGVALTSNEIGELCQAQDTIKMFLDSIHYEVAELIDVPFTQSLEPVINDAYDLSPKNFRTKDNFLFVKRGSSLEDLILSTMTDDQLKKDFKEKSKNLNKDKPDKDIVDALNDAKFWAKEFEKASAIRDLQQEFLNEHAAEWDNLSVDEKKKLMEEYAVSVGKALDEKGFWDWFRGDPIAKKVKWFTQDGETPTPAYDPNNPPTSLTWGYTYSKRKDGKIYMNDAFGPSDPMVFDINKMLNTTTHEVRHQYQQQAVSHPNRFGSASIVDKWKLKNQGTDYYIKPIEIDARAFAALATY